MFKWKSMSYHAFLLIYVLTILSRYAVCQESVRSVTCAPSSMKLCILSRYKLWAWKELQSTDCQSKLEDGEICLSTAPDACGTTVDLGNDVQGGGADGQWFVHRNDAKAIGPLALLDPNPIIYEVLCLYSRDLQVTTQIERETIKTVSVAGSGVFDIQMAFCLDRDCNTRLTEDPLIAPPDLTEMVVEISTSVATGFFLDLKHCWTSSKPNDPNAVVVLKDYCENPTKVGFETLRKEKDVTRVSYPLFRLKDQPFVYFYCSVLVCQKENGCYNCDKRGNPSRIEEDTVQVEVESEKASDDGSGGLPPDTDDDAKGPLTFGKGPFLIDEAVIILGDEDEEDDSGGRTALLYGLAAFLFIFCTFVAGYLFTKYVHMREGRNPDKFFFLYHMTPTGAPQKEVEEALPVPPVKSKGPREGRRRSERRQSARGAV